MFSPSVFSPSVFSPSVFSPDAYSPSVFSPSVFSPSVFSPSVFSPSVFSPSVFSPSVFSPSVFSPSVFSPSVFSPSVFSPSVFSPAGGVFSPEAFASAQTRSLIATSSTPGTGDESVVADTWNNTGSFYIRVSGRNGAFATASPFTLSVTRDDLPACVGVNDLPGSASASGTGYQTVILLDSSRMPVSQTGNSATDVATLRTDLTAFAGRGEVQGAIVDLAGDARIQALNTQADDHKGCPYAKNLVAAAIKSIVTAYRAVSPALKYVVLVGSDGAIPFFRYPDEGLLGPESDYVPPVGSDTSSEASLRLNYVLGQDEYGSATTLALGGGTFPVPGLAVGRLVETAAEASGMLTAYAGLTGGVTVTPTKALVTGYDFLADAANAVAGDLAAGIGGTPGPGQPVDTIIAPNNISPQDPLAWTAADLRTKLFGSRHDLVFLAGHFSANSALAADFATSALSTELAGSTTDFTNSVIFSAGCHAGYNIVDGDAVAGVTAPLDWAQAFARKKATLIAGTGYQYGDTDFLEYSERIYSGFARQLRYGSGPVAVGQALMRAKQTYLKETPDPRGLHRKALLESALFGLPMLSVNLPQGRIPAPADASIIGGVVPFAADPGLTLGLSSADATVTGTLTPHTVRLDVLPSVPAAQVDATYYSGPDGVVTNPAEPALPLISKDVTVPGKVLRGVGFRGGTYTDSTILPLTGAATTELRGVHAPFVSPVFFPMRLATVNYFDALTGGDTRLLVTPAQHKAIPGSNQSTLRLFGDVALRLFYSANIAAPALSAAPSISAVAGVVEGADIVMRASVTGNPAAGIQQVWVTYTGDAARWASLDLAQCVVTAAQPALPVGCGVEESTRWVGRIAGGAGLAAGLRFMVQAANGVGLVTMDDALGTYYGVSQPAVAAAPPPVTTSLALQNPPASAVYGASVIATAVLTSAGAPLGGRVVTLMVGSSSTMATTDGNGVATATLPVNVVPGASNVRAAFAGDPGLLLASSSSSPLTVQKSPTTLALGLTPPPGTPGPLGVKATLTGANGAPLQQRTVYLVITGAGPTQVIPLITDYLGRAVISPLALAAGSYSLTAMFLGSVPLPTPTVLSDSTYLASTASTAAVVVAVADLAVTGTAAPNPVVSGTPLTYSFTVINNGPDVASNVNLTDTLPPSLATPTTSTPGCGVTSGVLRCAFASLSPGPGLTVTLTGTPSVTGPLSNTANVSADGTDPVAANDSATVTADVRQPTSAPAVVNVVGPSSVSAGSVYTATATSDGNPAPTFTFAASPAKPSWLSINPATGGISGTVPLTGTTAFAYQVVATNSVGTKAGPLVTVTVTPIADLRLDMITPGLFIGVPSTYAISVTNTSNLATTGVVIVTDTLPAGLNYRTFLAPGWACAAAQRTVTCTFSRSLSARSITALALFVDVTATKGTVITNTARVAPADGTPSNNSATVQATVRKP